MGLSDKFKNADTTAAEQAVVVQFNFPAGNLDRIFEIEEQLAQAAEQASAGQLDGNEIAVDGRDNLFYLYGPDADKLFAAIEPVLLASEILSEAKVLLRYGPPGLDTKQNIVRLPKWSAVQH